MIFDQTPDGFRVWDDAGAQLAHVRTRWPNDDHRNAVVSWDPLPREQWMVHLTGAVAFGLVREMLDGVVTAEGSRT